MTTEPSPEDRRRAERGFVPGARVEGKVMTFTPPGARVSARRKGTILGLFGSGESFGGELVDISQLGLRFLAPQKLALEARLKVCVIFTQASDTLDCIAVVRWSHPHARPGLFVVGVEFEKLDDAHIKLLEKVKRATLTGK